MELSKRNKQLLFCSLLVGLGLVVAGLMLLRVEHELQATGTVLPHGRANLYAPEDATVVTVHVRAADRVQRGQPLITLENSALRGERDALLQEALETRLRLAHVELDLKAHAIQPEPVELVTAPRRAELYAEIATIQDELASMYAAIREQYIISDMDLKLRTVEQLRAEIDGLESAVRAEWSAAGLSQIDRDRLEHEQALLREKADLQTGRLDTLEQRMAALTVTAPLDGIVTALNVRYPGQHAEQGAWLARIADPDGGYRLRVHAPPRNIDLVRTGLPVRIESGVFDAVLEGYAYGHVARVIPEATDPETGLYEIDIQVEESPYPLMWGAPATARIMLGRRSLFRMFFRGNVSERDTLQETAP